MARLKELSRLVKLGILPCDARQNHFQTTGSLEGARAHFLIVLKLVLWSS